MQRTVIRSQFGTAWCGRCIGACDCCAWMVAAAWLSLLLLGGSPLASAAADAVVVIVHKDNPNQVDRAFILGVYTGSIHGWPNGWPVVPLDQADHSEARQLFAADVLHKRPAALGAIWSQNIFTGKGLPPRKIGADEDMLRAVAANRNAIGYVLRSELDDRIRALAW